MRFSRIEVAAPNSLPVHNLVSGLSYAAIQEAIDASETLSGHILQVGSGTYYEHVVVNKGISLIGADRHHTIIDGNGRGTVITVSADYASVVNFTIRGGGAPHAAGVFLDSSQNTLIANNVIRENLGNAIYLSEACENIIRDNTITSNRFGIFAWLFSGHNNITENRVTNNEVGIHFVMSSNNNIVGNTLTNNDVGLYAFYHCRENEIRENLVENNDMGIKLADGCDDNRIYHNNFISNTEQALIFDPEAPIFKGIEPSVNLWDDGYPSGGNYWSDYFGVDSYRGPYQNESGRDVIGDASYVIGDDNEDGYPLMYHWRILTVPMDYATVQAAINAASSGDTIYVFSGTYYEHVRINKSVSLIGTNKYTTIIDGNATGCVVRVTADHVTISGFTIQRGGCDVFEDWGDCLHLASNDNTICQNILRTAASGIYLPDRHRNTIRQNVITNTTAYGLRMFRSSNNVVVENNITDTGFPAIFVARSREIELRKNFLLDNQGGIYLGYCSNSSVSENAINRSWVGITLEHSSFITVKGNSVADNWVGLFLGPLYGPSQPGTRDNVLVENTAVNNENGIQTTLADQNLICRNNFITNTRQFHSRLSTNIWDDGSDGNYWSDYTGMDLNLDGIGDTSHIIDASNADHWPLMGRFSDCVATSEHHVRLVSNSTISAFRFNGTAIVFTVSGETGTTGFCRVGLPRALMNGTIDVFVNGAQVPYALLPCSTSTQRVLYFGYAHSAREVAIIPELPPVLILPLLLTAVLLVVRRRYASRVS
jgi:parallel beta-helix repeat protein